MHTVTATAWPRAHAVAALACLAGVTLAGCGTYRAGTAGPVPTSSRGGAVPASAVSRLTVMARRFAKVNGGAVLTEASAVLTTHRKALTSATPGDTVPGSGGVPVYLVTMRGHFTAYAASVPPGAAAPTGRYASLVVDARTFRVMDWGVGPKPPPVSPTSLGPVTDLLNRTASATR